MLGRDGVPGDRPDRKHPDGLERLRSAHARARARVWELTGAPELLDIDLDATLVGSHSEKGDAAGNFKGGCGFHCSRPRLNLTARPSLSASHVKRRATIAVLVFAGLRIGELCSLHWRDVDLATGWLSIDDSKTDAGRRRIKIRPALASELSAVRGGNPDADPDEIRISNTAWPAF